MQEVIVLATLTIRNVDPQVHQRLRERAAGNGRSVEAELRALLAQVVGEPELNLGDAIRAEVLRVGDLRVEIAPRVDVGRGAALR